MFDLYHCYADLAAAKPQGVHYRVRVVERASQIVVVAPHGGRIEPGASETAALIAAGDFSRYGVFLILCGCRNLYDAITLRKHSSIPRNVT